MLSCALPFEGKNKIGSAITGLMVAAGLLTKNIRDGQADAWRDYQQLLAELGLIYSTRISSLHLTELAKSYVGGDIDYSSLMGLQTFRYQYPNGQKYTIQDNLRSAIAGGRFGAAANQIDLHVDAGVLIRPAVLLLRVLFELNCSGDLRPLKLEEIRQFLLPSRTNSEWPHCVQEVQQARTRGLPIGGDQRDSTRRNLQDWFKLLKENPFFETDGRVNIKLSEIALTNLAHVQNIIEYGEEIGNFWIPLNSSVEEQKRWFSTFGQYGDVASDIEASSSQSQASEEAVSDDFDEDDASSQVTLPVVLTDVNEDALLNRKEFASNFDAAQMAENVIKGTMKRYAKHMLHNEIVAEFARKFKAQGARVVSDPNSVDLLVFWGEKSALFEIKTVSYKNFQSRMRLALGQIEEYSFRLNKEHGLSPDRCVILNRYVDTKSWQAEFFAEHMKVGIMSRTSSGNSLISPHGCKSCCYWN
jgi:hypothetical protein